MQQDLVALSPMGRQIVVGTSGHFIHLDEDGDQGNPRDRRRGAERRTRTIGNWRLICCRGRAEIPAGAGVARVTPQAVIRRSANAASRVR